MNCFSCETGFDPSSEDDCHEACARKLFSVAWTPKILFSSGDIASEAQKMVGKMSISGVQPKLSVSLNRDAKILEVTAVKGTHILKPSPGEFPFLAENENLCMNLAKELSIETPAHGLLRLSDDRFAYVVRRFDRSENEKDIHVEDFAQILGKEDKYIGSVEQIGAALKKFSEIPFIDTQRLFLRMLFNFLIGNGDAHLKNFSMVRVPGKGYRFSDAYDIVSSRLVLPNESEEMAISVNGKRNNMRLKDFKALAEYLELPEKRYENILDMARGLKQKAEEYAMRCFLPEKLKTDFLRIFDERFKRLF